MPFLPFSRTLSGLSPRRASTTVPNRPRARSRKDRLGSAYARCFGSPRYRRVNDLLLYLSVRGLGFENWRDHVISGEERFLRALLSRAGELPVILDVGAYHGEYAKAARRHSPRAIIYCFEPHPRTFQKLERTAQDHALIPLPVAAGRGAAMPICSTLQTRMDRNWHLSTRILCARDGISRSRCTRSRS
jgi:hypothetical protein